MAREIAEQPEAVRRTLEALLPRRGELQTLAAGKHRVLFVARGSSDNAATYGRYLLEAHAGVVAGPAAPSIATHYRAPLDLSDTVLVAISQSGATSEIVETARWGRERGAVVVGITNEVVTPLAASAHATLITAAGHETAVPATKSHLTQLTAVAVLGDALGAGVAADLARVPEEVARLVDRADEVETAVAALRRAAHVVTTGRGLCLGAALEAALKIEETCLRPVRGYSYADLRHGPISVVEESVAALLVAAPDGPLTTGMHDLAGDLADRGATTVAVGGDPALAAACPVSVPGPDLPEAVAPLGLVVPVQLLAERLARALGLDPDQPRGLAKVTQTDRH